MKKKLTKISHKKKTTNASHKHEHQCKNSNISKHNAILHLRKIAGLPWWSNSQEFACQCRRHRNIPHAAGQLSLCATTTEDRAPQSPRSATREAAAIRSPRTATRVATRGATRVATRGAPPRCNQRKTVCSNEDPGQPIFF